MAVAGRGLGQAAAERDHGGLGPVARPDLAGEGGEVASTVCTPSDRSAAVSRLLRPAATRRNTSTSRRVRPSAAAGGQADAGGALYAAGPANAVRKLDAAGQVVAWWGAGGPWDVALTRPVRSR